MLKTKKILLIIFIIMAIFQMVVLATAIDVGNAAVDADATIDDADRTYINKLNPANESGTITTVEIWANTNLGGCKVATFYNTGEGDFSTRDYETVNNGAGAGVVTAGSKQTFTVDLDVATGDLIGIYFSSGAIESDYGSAPGTNVWYDPGDNIPCIDNHFYTYSSREWISLYGTGATAEEDGSEGNPWQVADYTELKKVGTGTDDWNMDDYYIQTANIDASASATENPDNGGYYGFMPIGGASGTDYTDFTGHYDGQGYTISNLYINRGGDRYVGLFARPNHGGSTIQDIHLVDCDITGNDQVGGIAGNTYHTNITQCSVTGDIVSNNQTVGGITGHYRYGTISKCMTDVDITAGGNTSGGIVGYIHSATVSNCYAHGDVTAPSNYRAGGLIGENYKSAVTYCYAKGAVSGSIADFCGGLTATITTGSPYADTENYWDITTSGTEISAMGTGKATADMKDIDTYTDGGNWDMVVIGSYSDEDWYIDDGNDYPHLGWEWEEPEEEAEANVLFIFSDF